MAENLIQELNTRELCTHIGTVTGSFVRKVFNTKQSIKVYYIC